MLSVPSNVVSCSLTDRTLFFWVRHLRYSGSARDRLLYLLLLLLPSFTRRRLVSTPPVVSSGTSASDGALRTSGFSWLSCSCILLDPSLPHFASITFFIGCASLLTFVSRGSSPFVYHQSDLLYWSSGNFFLPEDHRSRRVILSLVLGRFFLNTDGHLIFSPRLCPPVFCLTCLVTVCLAALTLCVCYAVSVFVLLCGYLGRSG